MAGMKVIRHSSRANKRLLHIEAEGCVVNIRVGMTTSENVPVTSVEVIPDQDWALADYPDQRTANVRVWKVEE